jgi:hypothetical protein
MSAHPVARDEVWRQEEQREEDQPARVGGRRAPRLQRDQLHEAGVDDAPQRAQQDQQDEAERTARDRDPERERDHHDHDRDHDALGSLRHQPAEHDRVAGDRDRPELVEVAALDLLDQEQRGHPKRGREEEGDRELEGAVALPLEEPGRVGGEDLRGLACVDDQEEDRDEHGHEERVRLADRLPQRDLAGRDREVDATDGLDRA